MFSAFFIKRPRFSFVISIVIMLVGILAIFNLPIALYPEVTPPQVTVSAMYPGASADVIAKTIGIPLEDEINGVEDMLYMNSSSQDSAYTLTVTFKTGVDPDIAQVKVQNRIQQATSKLPDEVTRQGISVKRESSNILGFIVFSSKDGSMSEQQVADYVYNNIERTLAKVHGVGAVEVYSSQLSMRIWLNADKMAALQITADEIYEAIASQNYQPSLGKVGASPTKGLAPMVYTLQTQGRLMTEDEFEQIIVRTAEQGGLVRLKDVADIELGQENYAISGLFNGKSAVSMALNLSSGANALETMEVIKTSLEEMKKFFPEGMDYTIAYDSNKYVEASVEEVVLTLILTLVLVVAVCYFFLQDFYSTLIPTLTIPVSILGTFAVMLALGYSINMFTLFALLLAIGSVVDDAIVVVERVVFLIQHENMNAREATYKAMGEISGALVAMSFIVLKPWGDRTSWEDFSTNIMYRLQAKMMQFPEAQFQFFEMPAIPGLGTANGLDIRLQSRQTMDYQKLDAALQSFLGKVNQLPSIAYAYTTFNAITPNIFLDIDRVKAESMKVSMGTIFSTLETYLGSAYVNDINLGTQVNKVMMQSDWKYRDNIDNINELYVRNNLGRMVPLRGLIEIHKILAPRVVERYNQYPVASIKAVQKPGSSTGDAMMAVEKLVDSLPKGYSIEWSTMSYQEKMMQGQIGFLLALSLIFAYLFLVAQYESFIIPIPVILSLSVAVGGAMLGLFFSGMPLSIYSQLGIILLVGMASKNAILIVEFAKEEREKGATIVNAAVRGLKERFRAVLMTAASFVLGVWPMIIAFGAAAASRRSLGVPIFLGMLIGTIVGLFVIPMFYVLVQTMYEKLMKRK